MAAPDTIAAALPAVPLTIEGYSVLHQMLKVKWNEWNALAAARREELLQEARSILSAMESRPDGGSALFSLLGHKGDLILIHFRNSFDELKQAELDLCRLGIWNYLEPVHSYLSIIELGLYESTAKTYKSLSDRGVTPFSEEWDSEIAAVTARQKEAMRPRLFPEIPSQRYLCFYPMDRKRGEDKNWYQESMPERQRMMHEHGMIGRRYAGTVKQIITGSIGFDDWEWGVDLFADDPLVFKKLIYEMRFDEVSAVYALFGTFFVGIRVAAGELGELMNGRIPAARE